MVWNTDECLEIRDRKGGLIMKILKVTLEKHVTKIHFCQIAEHLEKYFNKNFIEQLK